MKITLLSPYHGGSHRAWAEGLVAHSSHQIEPLTLPARYWKWRMHGGALTLARRFATGDRAADVILATDMIDLTTFTAVARPRVPIALYMHENQLTYPLPADGATGPMRRQLGERDRHYAFINFASMAAADAVYFNSHFHRDAWFDALPAFLRHLPEFNELAWLPILHARSSVLPVGIDRTGLAPAPAGDPPLIIWNQRWEYDKNPGRFFQSLYAVRDAGVPFRLALCGQNFRQRPSEFETALIRLADHIIHVGHAPARTYRRLLGEATVTVSTADHEFFGISILEAIAAHTFPILPRRLSYPELLPEAFHDRCLYDDDEGLVNRLTTALTAPERARTVAAALAAATAHFAWPQLAPAYDHALTNLFSGYHAP